MMREVNAHLSKELRSQYKRRSMAVRKGDEIKIIRGKHFGKAGAVSAVDLKENKILVSGVTLKRTIGTEKQVPVEPSNVVITSLNLSDNMRQRILLRKVKEVKVEKPKVPEAVAEKKEEAAEAAPAVEEKREVPKPKTVKAREAKPRKVSK